MDIGKQQRIINVAPLEVPSELAEVEHAERMLTSDEVQMGIPLSVAVQASGLQQDHTSN